MSGNLANEIDLEFEQLRKLLHVHRPLVLKSFRVAPEPIETSALAAMLQCFYNGVENLLKRIELGTGGRLHRGKSWHRDLLEAASRRTATRGAVISEELSNALRPYLQFRHVFRQAYTYELQWSKMAPLVERCEQTLSQLESEIREFRIRQEI